MRYWWLLVLSLFALAGCSTSARAPVSPLTRVGASAARAAAAQPAPGTYVVRQGDTLYSIALAHDLDYKQLAQWNQLASPDVIEVGQQLRLSPPPASASASAMAAPAAAGNAAPQPASGGVMVTPLASTPPPQGQVLGQAQGGSAAPGALPVISAPVVSRLAYSEENWNAVRQGVSAAPSSTVPAPQSSPPAGSGTATGTTAVAPTPGAAASGPIQWQWPAQGNIVERYGQNGNKGIDIAGSLGAPVVAVAPGKVVYSGTGLRGYGLLIIIRHADDYLSAYAHNEKAMVKEGQQVQAGQVIALMGNTDAKQVELHFEIRRFGKALDPLKLLPPRT